MKHTKKLLQLMENVITNKTSPEEFANEYENYMVDHGDMLKKEVSPENYEHLLGLNIDLGYFEPVKALREDYEEYFSTEEFLDKIKDTLKKIKLALRKK